MQFTFKRDREGRETIAVDGVVVAQFYDAKGFKEWEYLLDAPHEVTMSETYRRIERAMKSADGAGFWDTDDDGRYIWDECRLEESP